MTRCRNGVLKSALAIAATLLVAGAANAETMRMAATTSFQHSGLADILLPAAARDIEIDVQLLVVGTGQALRLGRAGDVDAVLVHSRAAEEAFVADGFATHRREIMFNDFVLIGPAHDPAGIAEAGTAAAALAGIARAAAPFVSRGDDSGTHKRELALWRAAQHDPQRFGKWYRAVGAGMGAALNAAAAMDAYILSDRASWMKFGNKRGLVLLHAGDPALLNQYAYLPVSPAQHPHVKHLSAAALERWLAGPRARALINNYTIDGVRLFHHNATEEQAPPESQALPPGSP